MAVVILKKFKIFKLVGTKLAIPTECKYGEDELIFQDYYDTEQEAITDISILGDEFDDYVIQPYYKKGKLAENEFDETIVFTNRDIE